MFFISKAINRKFENFITFQMLNLVKLLKELPSLFIFLNDHGTCYIHCVFFANFFLTNGFS